MCARIRVCVCACVRLHVCVCFGMCLSRMTMCGFFEKAARTFKALLGGPNTYQELFSPGNIFYQRKDTASTFEVASRCRDC